MPMIILDFFLGSTFPLSYASSTILNHVVCGIRLSAAIISFIVAVYYQIIITWAFRYMFLSFQYVLPWSVCDNDTMSSFTSQECEQIGSVSYFWLRRILAISGSIDENGSFCPELMMGLALSWSFVYIKIYRKDKNVIRSEGKFPILVTAFAVFMIMVYLWRALSLAGSSTGFQTLLSFDIKNLRSPRIWVAAISQVFYSHGITFCGLVTLTMTHHGRFDHIKGKTVFIGLWNCLPALMMGSFVISALGYKYTLQHNRFNTTSNDTIFIKETFYQGGEGAGVSFIAISLVSDTFGDFRPLMSVLMFAMVILVGIHGQSESIIGINMVMKSLEIIPTWLPGKGKGKEVLCVLGWIFGLLFVQDRGYYWLELFDRLLVPCTLMVIATTEIVITLMVYGLKRFTNDLEIMRGKHLPVQWIIRCVVCVVPFSLLSIFIVKYFKESLTYVKLGQNKGLSEDYPWYSVMVVGILILLSITPILTLAILNYFGLYSIPNQYTDNTRVDANQDQNIIVVVNGGNANVQIGNNNVQMGNNNNNNANNSGSSIGDVKSDPEVTVDGENAKLFM